ncbi:MAG: FAD-binding oxidoreductase [Trueperaceae bacterium]|nr:MAG: FAD-binding oxidoreductase [Trueperaceae bacterium]
MERFDAVVVGAGSVGLPTALALAESGLRTVVLDAAASLGQGAHKAAIGGVRATHGDPAKMRVGRHSLDAFRTWQGRYGDDIEWVTSGYAFVAYREREATMLQRLVAAQRSAGLDVVWLDGDGAHERVPALAREGLLGAAWSPGDGHCSTLLAGQAMAAAARRSGASFRFGERVLEVIVEGGSVVGVRTDRGAYASPVVVNAAGAGAAALAQRVGDSLEIASELHEAGITEAVAPFLGPLVVDITPGPGSVNVYCYQTSRGQVIFCLTPEPAILGDDLVETSAFLPQVATRLVTLIPRIQHLRVRRTWRGVYPMTPDASPLVGWSSHVEGLLHAAGMCGQGFMLGPGVGALIARMLHRELGDDDHDTLTAWAPERDFAGREALR